MKACVPPNLTTTRQFNSKVYRSVVAAITYTFLQADRLAKHQQALQIILALILLYPGLRSVTKTGQALL
jgi:hypothetical protein